jgi:hypothetical protein
MKSLDRQNKAFVSELDITLAALREKYPETAAQKAEREKHEKIAQLRDKVQPDQDKSELWEGF